MMFSEKAKKQADACRFCWMCRYLCPVQLVTGRETNTPRAKGLQVSMIERGMPMEADCARTMYECLLCGACAADCATGYDPLIYIREARTQANVLDIVPKNVRDVIDRLLDTGNLYGAEACPVDFNGIPEKAGTLVWLGGTARYAVPGTAKALFAILRKAGVEFAVLRDEPPSGAALGDLTGYVEDVRTQAQAAAEAIRASGAKRVVVLDSYDAALMRHEYPEWGIDLPEVVTAPAFVDALVREGKLTLRQDGGKITYHDSSRLARDLEEYEPARNLLRAMGYEICEMWQNRRLTRCCGSSAARAYMPEICEKIARLRWDDASRTEAKLLTAACPQSTEGLAAAVPEGYEYADLFELVERHL